MDWFFVFSIYLFSHIIKYAFHKLPLLLYMNKVRQLKWYRMHMQVRLYEKIICAVGKMENNDLEGYKNKQKSLESDMLFSIYISGH